MNNAIRNMITCVGISIVALIATHALGAGEAARPRGQDVGAAALACEGAAATREVAEAGRCGKCGDGACNPRCGETAESCPVDCGSTTSLVDPAVPSSERACSKCGDGSCTPQCGETAASCPVDCGGVPS